MEENQPKIKIDDPISRIDAKFDLYIKFVIGILVVAVLTMIFMLGGILLEAWHFNTTTYKEYSKKIESVETTQKTNETLLKQIQELSEQSKEDREIIKGLLIQIKR